MSTLTERVRACVYEHKEGVFCEKCGWTSCERCVHSYLFEGAWTCEHPGLGPSGSRKFSLGSCASFTERRTQ